MTAVSDVDEATLDLDWFAIDKDHALGHFTTGVLRPPHPPGPGAVSGHFMSGT